MSNMRKKFRKTFGFFWFLIGNLIQIFIILIFVDFLRRKFNEWLVDFYVLTNCNYTVFCEMFDLLGISAAIVIGWALIRYIWFKTRYLKRTAKQKKEKNYVTKD